jgi:5-formyltetrahydrofolate cyclo-ligase
MRTDPKIEVRRQFREARRLFVAGLDKGTRAALETDLAGHAAPITQKARVPASYAAQGAEIDPFEIEKSLPPHAFPRVSGDDLFFHFSAWKDLAPGFGNIPEPPATAPLVTPDLVLVPLIAATIDGRRLGQGGGFYDRALKRLRAEGQVIALGLAWDVQITETLPIETFDEWLDYVATPTRLVDCRQYR